MTRGVKSERPPKLSAEQIGPIASLAGRPEPLPSNPVPLLLRPLKGFALLRFATALRVTGSPAYVLRPALIGTRNDLLRLRRGIEQGMIEKRGGHLPEPAKNRPADGTGRKKVARQGRRFVKYFII